MKTRRAPRAPQPAAQIMVGVLVIALGLLFLLDNLGLLDFDYTLHAFPLLLTVLGLLKIVQARSTRSMVVGALMVLAGVLLTLRSLGLLFISWRTLWPLILIALGIGVVYRSVMAQREAQRPADFNAKVADDSSINATVVMGSYVRRLVAPDFRGGELTAIMAGCELDLRQSVIHGDAVLNVLAVCGGIQIKVPPDWTVVLRGTPILGGFEEKTALPADGSRRLIIQGHAILGGVEVGN